VQDKKVGVKKCQGSKHVTTVRKEIPKFLHDEGKKREGEMEGRKEGALFGLLGKKFGTNTEFFRKEQPPEGGHGRKTRGDWALLKEGWVELLRIREIRVGFG